MAACWLVAFVVLALLSRSEAVTRLRHHLNHHQHAKGPNDDWQSVGVSWGNFQSFIPPTNNLEDGGETNPPPDLVATAVAGEVAPFKETDSTFRDDELDMEEVLQIQPGDEDDEFLTYLAQVSQVDKATLQLIMSKDEPTADQQKQFVDTLMQNAKAIMNDVEKEPQDTAFMFLETQMFDYPSVPTYGSLTWKADKERKYIDYFMNEANYLRREKDDAELLALQTGQIQKTVKIQNSINSVLLNTLQFKSLRGFYLRMLQVLMDVLAKYGWLGQYNAGPGETAAALFDQIAASMQFKQPTAPLASSQLLRGLYYLWVMPRNAPIDVLTLAKTPQVFLSRPLWFDQRFSSYNAFVDAPLPADARDEIRLYGVWPSGLEKDPLMTSQYVPLGTKLTWGSELVDAKKLPYLAGRDFCMPLFKQSVRLQIKALLDSPLDTVQNGYTVHAFLTPSFLYNFKNSPFSSESLKSATKVSANNPSTITLDETFTADGEKMLCVAVGYAPKSWGPPSNQKEIPTILDFRVDLTVISVYAGYSPNYGGVRKFQPYLQASQPMLLKFPAPGDYTPFVDTLPNNEYYVKFRMAGTASIHIEVVTDGDATTTVGLALGRFEEVSYVNFATFEKNRDDGFPEAGLAEDREDGFLLQRWIQMKAKVATLDVTRKVKAGDVCLVGMLTNGKVRGLYYTFQLDPDREAAAKEAMTELVLGWESVARHEEIKARYAGTKSFWTWNKSKLDNAKVFEGITQVKVDSELKKNWESFGFAMERSKDAVAMAGSVTSWIKSSLGDAAKNLPTATLNFANNIPLFNAVWTPVWGSFKFVAEKWTSYLESKRLNRATFAKAMIGLMKDADKKSDVDRPLSWALDMAVQTFLSYGISIPFYQTKNADSTLNDNNAQWCNTPEICLYSHFYDCGKLMKRIQNKLSEIRQLNFLTKAAEMTYTRQWLIKFMQADQSCPDFAKTGQDWINRVFPMDWKWRFRFSPDWKYEKDKEKEKEDKSKKK